MLPTIWPGDVLLIASRHEDQFACGDLVLVKRQGGIVIHRLVGKDGAQWITRGDAMPQNDPAVSPGDVLGGVSEIHRGRRVILTTRGHQPLRRVLGGMLCHSKLFRTIALRAHAAGRECNSYESCPRSAGQESLRCN